MVNQMPEGFFFNYEAALKAAQHMASQKWYKVHIMRVTSNIDPRIKYQVATQGIRRRWVAKPGKIIDHSE